MWTRSTTFVITKGLTRQTFGPVVPSATTELLQAEPTVDAIHNLTSVRRTETPQALRDLGGAGAPCDN